MKNFRPVDRDTGFLMPPSVDEWLPERHLARFMVEVIEGLDVVQMIAPMFKGDWSDGLVKLSETMFELTKTCLHSSGLPRSG